MSECTAILGRVGCTLQPELYIDYL